MERIRDIIKPSVDGLTNNFDSDAIELSATSTLRKIPIMTQIITYKTPTPNTKSCKTVKNTNLTVKNTNLCEIPRNITVGEWLDENNRTGEDDLCEDDVQIYLEATNTNKTIYDENQSSSTEDYTINNNYENNSNENHENQTINETEIDENSS